MSKGTNVRRGRKKESKMLRRTRLVEGMCGIVALALAAYLFYVQVIKHDYYEAAAVEQQMQESTVLAKRGTIYDSDMNILAMSATVYNVYLSPAEIVIYDEDPALISQTLANILQMDYQEIYEKTLDTDSWYSMVATKVENDQSDAIQAFIDEYNLKGVRLEETSRRYYPYNEMACHVIGFVGSDEHGLSGIEYYYDDVLSGTDGRIVSMVNAAGTNIM